MRINSFQILGLVGPEGATECNIHNYLPFFVLLCRRDNSYVTALLSTLLSNTGIVTASSIYQPNNYLLISVATLHPGGGGGHYRFVSLGSVNHS